MFMGLRKGVPVYRYHDTSILYIERSDFPSLSPLTPSAISGINIVGVIKINTKNTIFKGGRNHECRDNETIRNGFLLMILN